jgi:hypothetical protein
MVPRKCFLLAALAPLASGSQLACNLTGAWQSVGSDDPIAVIMDPATFAFVASAASGWTNQTGLYYPINASVYFSCCGGITGAVSAACDAIQWRDANADAWARGAPRAAVLSTPMYDVGLGVAPGGGAPSIDTFAIFGAGAKTINFALTGQRMAGGTQLLPAAAGRAGGGSDDVTARCSTAGGGCVLNATATLVSLAGLELAAAAAGGGAAAVAASE